LDEEQHKQAAGEVRNSRQASGQRQTHWHTDENVDTVESLLLSQEDKPQSHRTVSEISHDAGIHQSPISWIIHKIMRLNFSSAARKGALNS